MLTLTKDDIVSEERQFEDEWLNFSSLGLEGTSALEGFVIKVLLEFGWEKETGIPEVPLWSIVREAAERYSRSNPYHNFRHAVDVFQATAYFLRAVQKEIPRLFPPFAAVALLTAALFHDAGHFGLTNSEMKKHPLALVYGESSINEKWHATQAHAVLSKWTDNEEFVSLVLRLILATDPDSEPSLESDLKGSVTFWIEILRTADVSNSARSLEVAEQWRKLYTSETAPHHPPPSARQAVFAASKTEPGLKLLSCFCPAAFEPLLRQLRENIDSWNNATK